MNWSKARRRHEAVQGSADAASACQHQSNRKRLTTLRHARCRIEIDINLIENKIRPLALGRKNYLFAGSRQGARRAAMMYSLLGSCREAGHQ